MAEYITPKGMKDYSGAQMMLRERMTDTIRAVYQRWGYEPLSTPALEMKKTLAAKAGDEIAGQLFEIEESDLALRFDLTVGLARFAANSSMPKPYKRYCIAPVWRREEPQKGRLREFLQADADIIGSADMRCEAELLAMASEALKALGFEEFEIIVNNRKILNEIIRKLKCEKYEGAVLRALDKSEKIGKEKVMGELEGAGVGNEAAEKLTEIIMQKYEGNEKALKIAKEYSPQGAAEIENLLCILKYGYGMENVKVDLSLARGLGYYTGPVFEIKAGGGVGSVAGGGRYDDLLSLYGQGDFAVGISLGIERLFALKKEGIENSAPADVVIITIDDECYGAGVKIASKLREAGICVQTDLMARKMKGQLEYANACKIKFALFLGKKEIESGKFTLKNLESGEQKEMGLEGVIENISEKRR